MKTCECECVNLAEYRVFAFVQTGGMGIYMDVCDQCRLKFYPEYDYVAITKTEGKK